MSETPSNAVRRVLVSLDASPHGLAALEAAANLASQLHTELQAMFVEDVNLLRLAALPFAREVASSSGSMRQLNPMEMERTLQAEAEHVRRVLETIASQISIRWSFEITRGHVTRAPLAAASEGDLIIIGRESGTHQQRPFAIPPKKHCPLVAIYDGSHSSPRVLDAAARLAIAMDLQVLVVVTCPDREQAAAFQRDALAWLETQGVDAAGCEILTGQTNLADVADRCHTRLLLINRDSPLLTEALIDSLVNDLDCPIGLVN